MMNPEHKARWIAKLREEDRCQGTGCLKDQYGAQCCLDVGTEIAVEDGIIGEPVINLDGVDLDNYNYFWFDSNEDFEDWAYHDASHLWNMAEYESIPEPAWKYMGLIESNPRIDISQETLDKLEWGDEHKPGVYDLITLNDDWHLSFPEIATVIEDSDL